MIQTKVARVVSPTELVLAAGAKDGVEEGMEFIVYTLSDSVWDPDTGEDLGQIEIVKAKLVAAHVQEHMTIARTKSKSVKRIIDPLAPITELIAMVSIPHPFQRLEVSEMVFDQMPIERAEAITARDVIVRIGDLARTVTVTATAKIRNRELVVA